MMSPPHRPHATHTNMYQFLTILVGSVIKMWSNSLGSATQAMTNTAGVMSTVEMMSCILSVCSISLTMRAGLMSVAMRVVRRQHRMPAAETSRGNIIDTQIWCTGRSVGPCEKRDVMHASQ